ncbi:type III pantothenate kinase [Spongorhabdus nitratireducens]
MSKGVLDIDAGNTRLKWRLQDETGRIILSGFDHYQPHYKAVVHRVVDKLPFWPLRCRLSSVHTHESSQELAAALGNCLGTSVETLSPKSLKNCALTNTSPDKLGTDRWLGLIAGRKLYPEKPLMIVDAGTALTLDMCDSEGCYLGGYIVPGSRAHFGALAKSTRRLGRFCPDSLTEARAVREPSCHVKGALENGFVAMAAALIESEYSRFQQKMQIILSGGDGALLAHHLVIPNTCKPDLVLDGLGMALP